MISLENYRKRFEYIIIALAAYSIIFLFMSRHELYILYSHRSGRPDFYLGLFLLVIVLLFYWYYSLKIKTYQTKSLTEEDKEHLVILQTNIGHLKFAIISGFSAIIIGSLALISKIVPGFFITLVMTYYADQNL